MKSASRQTGGPRPGSRGRGAAFTLAEVLAALLFMAIVIPVAIEGLRIANLAGVVAVRKDAAARVAERVLNESIVTTNWNRSAQSGVIADDDRDYRWMLRAEPWGQGSLQLVSVEVLYRAQDRDYSVRLSTLLDSTPESTNSATTLSMR
jgi:hypothetical protein